MSLKHWKTLETTLTTESNYLALNLVLPIHPASSKSSHLRCSMKKGALINFTKFTGKHLCQSLFFHKIAGLKACNFIKKETMTQAFSCEFCKISKNTFFTEYLFFCLSVSCWIFSFICYSYLECWEFYQIFFSNFNKLATIFSFNAWPMWYLIKSFICLEVLFD